MQDRQLIVIVSAAAALAIVGPASAGDLGPDDWPSFRGHQARGIADGHSTVTTWNIETGENIRWTTPIPGLTHSSPVIAGDRLYITAAIKEGGNEELKVGLYGSVAPVEDDSVHEFKVYCLDKNSGQILWERLAVKAVPAVKRHPKGSHAASSPATDGQSVVAFFGSEGLYCYDIEGGLKWSKNFGVLRAAWDKFGNPEWGYASSPIIHDDLVIVQCDVLDNAFLAALNLETGEEVWRVVRDDVPTWSTPTVDVRDGRAQVICNGMRQIGGYDLRTGEMLWKLEGGGDIPVPTPIVAHDLIYITNAHGRQAPIYAIRPTVSGTITTDAREGSVAWSTDKLGNYMQTPIIVGDLAFFCNDGGVLTCYDARTGETHFRERLSSAGIGFTASPVAADGKIYYTSEIGEIYIVRADKAFEALAVNAMGVECMATPAISEGIIYWRTRSGVVAVGSKH
jgi:outer membrane protein assembly factor BamB